MQHVAKLFIAQLARTRIKNSGERETGGQTEKVYAINFKPLPISTLTLNFTVFVNLLCEARRN